MEILNVATALLLEAASQWQMAKIRIMGFALSVSQEQAPSFQALKGIWSRNTREFCSKFVWSAMITSWPWTFHLHRPFYEYDLEEKLDFTFHYSHEHLDIIADI